MSTKIYGGRAIDGDLATARDLLATARVALRPLWLDLQARFIGIRAAGIIDQASLRGERAASPARRARREMVQRQRKVAMTRVRDPAVDFDLVVSLLPDGNGAGPTTLAIVYTDCRDLRAWFDALPFVHDHAYWSNGDGPDHLSEGEWEARRLSWDRVLPPSGVPAERDVTVRMTPSIAARADRLDVMRHVPDAATRRSRLAVRRHEDDHVQRVLDGRQAKCGAHGSADPHSLVAARLAARGDVVGLRSIEDALSSSIRDLGRRDLYPSREPA